MKMKKNFMKNLANNKREKNYSHSIETLLETLKKKAMTKILY